MKMKKTIFLFLLLTLASQVEAQKTTLSSFIKPWDNTEKPIVIDVYSKNDYTINQITKEKRIKGIIHKLSVEDSSFFYKRRKEAYQNNLLYGSYYLPKYDTDGKKQADEYLKYGRQRLHQKRIFGFRF